MEPLIDASGVPTHECLNCGYNVFLVPAAFEDYDIAWWGLDATCFFCGSPATVVCPVDNPNFEPID